MLKIISTFLSTIVAKATASVWVMLILCVRVYITWNKYQKKNQL